MITINETGTWLYQYLIELGFNYYQAQLITAQAAHETGNFTSDIFKQNNNLFGMKYAKQKFAAGEKNGHAYYNTLEDSAKDFKIYYSLNDYNPTYKDIQTYIEALKEKKYFEAPGAEYLNGVKFFHNLYFGNGRA